MYRTLENIIVKIFIFTMWYIYSTNIQQVLYKYRYSTNIYLHNVECIFYKIWWKYLFESLFKYSAKTALISNKTLHKYFQSEIFLNLKETLQSQGLNLAPFEYFQITIPWNPYFERKTLQNIKYLAVLWKTFTIL